MNNINNGHTIVKQWSLNCMLTYNSEKKEKKEIRKEVKPKVKSKNRKSKIVNHK